MQRSVDQRLDALTKHRLVENYKSHFKQMKDRLKAFASTNSSNEIGDEDSGAGLYARPRPARKHQVDSEVRGGDRGPYRADLQSCVLQPISIEGNFTKSSQPHQIGQNRASIRSSLIGNVIDKENVEGNQGSLRDPRSDAKLANHLQLDQAGCQDVFLIQMSAPPLISFRGPLPGEMKPEMKDSVPQAKSCMSVHKAKEAEGLADKCKAESPQLLAAFVSSALGSPKTKDDSTPLVKARKRIAIDLTRPSEPDDTEKSSSLAVMVLSNTIPDSLRRECATFEDFESQLDAIKCRVLSSPCAEGAKLDNKCASNVKAVLCQPEASNKQSLPSRFVTSVENSIVEPVSRSCIQNRNRSPIGSAKKKTAGAVKTQDRLTMGSIHRRKASLHDRVCGTMACFKRPHEKAVAEMTAAGSTKVSSNQDTPNFFKSSHEVGVGGSSYFFRNHYKSRDSCKKVNSFALHSSRNYSQDLSKRSLVAIKTIAKSRKSSIIKRPETSPSTGPQSADRSPHHASRRELIRRLAKGEKSKIDRESMLRLTRKNYSNLPEVRSREKAKQTREELRERSQRIKEYDMVGSADCRRCDRV